MDDGNEMDDANEMGDGCVALADKGWMADDAQQIFDHDKLKRFSKPINRY